MTAALIVGLAVSAAAQPKSVAIVHSFNDTDGSSPTGLIRVGPQELWGVTQSGGLWGKGSIFRMTRDGRFTSVYSFLGLGDGAQPLGLVLGPDGAVYGTTAHITPFTGPSIWGTLFRVAPSGALTTLFVFREASVGYQPGTLIVTRDGTVFGYTNTGGAGGNGNIFQADTNGAITILHAFTASEGHGASLVEAADGTLWGTTKNGPNGIGILFTSTRAGVFTPFPVPQCAFAGWMHGLLPALDGTLYGTLRCEGDPNFSELMAHISSTGAVNIGPVSFGQWAFLTQGRDGTLLGSAIRTILRVAPDLSYSLFARAPQAASLADGLDGYFYGTSGGGLFGQGAIIRVSAAGGAWWVAGDFDGDHRADPAVFRPSTGVWSVKGSATPSSAMQFGLPGDVPLRADFDGDGLSDDVVFRPSNGTWHLRLSATSTVADIAFGAPGDIPVPAVSGTGSINLAVYRPSTGHWYRAEPDASLNDFEWGIPGDTPVPSDYDGDGHADLAVYRPSTGTWWIQSSPYGQIAYAWGIPGDVPVPADYDGDGKADIAMYRPSTGQWFILTSRSHFTGSVVFQWGIPGDLPVPAD